MLLFSLCDLVVLESFCHMVCLMLPTSSPWNISRTSANSYYIWCSHSSSGRSVCQVINRGFCWCLPCMCVLFFLSFIGFIYWPTGICWGTLWGSEQPQNSARPTCHCHAMTSMGRKAETTHTAAYELVALLTAPWDTTEVFNFDNTKANMPRSSARE